MSYSALLKKSLLYDLFARRMDSGICAVYPEHSEARMMKTQFFQAQDLSENSTAFRKPPKSTIFPTASNSRAQSPETPAPTLARWVAGPASCKVEGRTTDS